MDSLRRIFGDLHRSSDCFLIPNPFDAGTAVLLASTGRFKALASSSAGLAFTRGQMDSPTSLSLADTLAHLQSLVEATTPYSVPLNADFQNGFAAEGDYSSLKRNVMACARLGVAGLSIEDANETGGLYAFDEAVARVRAAREALDEYRRERGGEDVPPVLLTARCEAFLVGLKDIEEVVRRLVGFKEAGADCLFAPSAIATEEIQRIVEAVAPTAVNVLVSRGDTGLTVSKLRGLGVRRISVGSALSRLALRSFLSAAIHISDEGSFECLRDAMTFAELNSIFGSGPAMPSSNPSETADWYYPNSFTRLCQRTGMIQTAVKTYTRPSSSPSQFGEEVVLALNAHSGPSEYFESIVTSVAHCTDVFYESIGKNSHEAPVSLTPYRTLFDLWGFLMPRPPAAAASSPSSPSSSATAAQMRVSECLPVQLENWRNVDTNFCSIYEYLKQNCLRTQASIDSYLRDLFWISNNERFASLPDTRAFLEKMQLFVAHDSIMISLIRMRNEVVLEAIGKYFANASKEFPAASKPPRLGVVFGASHGDGMESNLASRFGFTLSHIEWLMNQEPTD